MDFFDFFFPEQAQAAHLRRIANTPSYRAGGVYREDLEGLERENRELRLYLSAVVQVLVEKQVLRAADVQAKVLSMLPPLPESSQAAAVPAENPFANLKLE